MKKKLVKVSIILLIVILVWLNLFQFLTFKEWYDGVETWQLLALDKVQLGPTGKYKVLGRAYGDYFCVWTKDRTIADVLETCTHEYGHNNLELADDRVLYWYQERLKNITGEDG